MIRKVKPFDEFRCKVGLFVQTAVKMSGATLSESTVQLSSNKMWQRLVNPKNDKMNPHGVKAILSILSSTPFPVAMQGLNATTL